MLGKDDQSSLIESGSQMLSSLLGNQDQNALSRAIGRFAGIGQGATGSLLGMLAPVVLGTITRQLGPRVDPSRITDLLAGQKDNIAAALPSGFADQLAGTGLLDSIGGAARTAAAAGSETLWSSASAARAAESTPPVGDPISQLSRDVANLKDTLGRLVSQVGDRGVKAVQGMRQSVASQVGSAATGMAGTGSDLVSTATGHAKTLASELEDMARRNPLGTIVGALLVGAVLGMMSRGRG
jgi:hypothetical protein